MFSDVITVVLAVLRHSIHTTTVAPRDKPLFDYVAAIYNLDTGHIHYAPHKEWPING